MGLSPEDHGLLNKVTGLPKGIYDKMREKYAGNNIALQQIDVYDGSTEYHSKIKELVEAIKSGEEHIVNNLYKWFDKNYPDIK